MTEYQRRWRLFGNGLLQAVYSGLIASLATFAADGLFSLGMDRKQFAAAIGSTTIAYVWGWLKNNQLPPLFQLDEDQIQTLVKVAEVAAVADAKIADVAEKAEADIQKLTKE